MTKLPTTSELYLKEAQKQIKIKEDKKYSMSKAQKEHLETEIRTSMLEAIFNYGA